jgi:hypothetical protein
MGFLTVLPYNTIGRLAAGASAALIATTIGACSLEVIDPEVVDPEQLNTVEALPTLLSGAIGDFKLAFSGSGGNTEGIILAGGMRADEWLNADTFDTRAEMDRGIVRESNGNNQTLFRNMQQARLSAEFAAQRYAALSPTDPGHAEAKNIAGFTYVLFGENYCSGVPFSSFDENGNLAFGDPLSTPQIFQRAIAVFDSALAIAGTSAVAMRNLALIGKARALLNLHPDSAAAAAALVTAIPTGFVYNIEHSENTTAENNGVFFLNNVNRRWSVANLEGVNGLNFRTANDIRVPVARLLNPATGGNRLGLDNRTPLFAQFKYENRSASIPLATGVEARLIEAEAQLRAGQTGSFLTTLNALRANTSLYRCPLNPQPNYTCPGNLTPLVLTGTETQAQLEDLLFRERAFWMFSTGHRLGDLRRLARPLAEGGYGRAYNTVFPTGAYHKGGAPYGPEGSFLVPVDEENNPQYPGSCDNQGA